MKSSKFQMLPDSSALLSVFNNDWGRLNDKQREDLICAIDETLLLYTDKHSYHVLADLLGRNYCNERALKVVSRLRQTENETARAIVTYGIGLVAIRSNDLETKKNASSELMLSQKDDSETVRQEANIALAKVSTGKSE